MVNSGETLTLLVTGAGAPGIRGTLYALRHNPDRRPVRIIGVDMQAKVVGALLADKFYTIPPPETAEYIAALLKICQREKRISDIAADDSRDCQARVFACRT